MNEQFSIIATLIAVYIIFRFFSNNNKARKEIENETIQTKEEIEELTSQLLDSENSVSPEESSKINVKIADLYTKLADQTFSKESEEHYKKAIQFLDKSLPKYAPKNVPSELPEMHFKKGMCFRGLLVLNYHFEEESKENKTYLKKGIESFQLSSELYQNLDMALQSAFSKELVAICYYELFKSSGETETLNNSINLLNETLIFFQELDPESEDYHNLLETSSFTSVINLLSQIYQEKFEIDSNIFYLSRAKSLLEDLAHNENHRELMTSWYGRNYIKESLEKLSDKMAS